ncbi:OmpA family protein [Larkinella bovis]|uniref:OmpA family protein n=1 Tax=Larkinella bovis TaxID=683041 RepID=A0ABW0I561_9BACT
MFTHKTPWVVLLLLWMGGSTYWHTCRIKLLCPDDASPATVSVRTTPEAPSFTPPGLEFTDGKTASFRSLSNLSFAKAGAEANVTSVKPLLDSLSLYLKSNPNKTIQLTGLYGPNESSAEANLGLARANNIRAYLMGPGIPESQFRLTGEESNALAFTPAGDSLYGGIRFAFLDEVVVKAEKPASEEDLAKKATFESIFRPMDLYFNTGKTDYIHTPETNEFLKNTKAYLKLNPNRKLVVTGHTDNIGSDEINLMLSKKRAAAVKKQFIAAGIAARQIEIQGKGEAQPIASNDTEEGRRTNRRTAVVVKQ